MRLGFIRALAGAVLVLSGALWLFGVIQGCLYRIGRGTLYSLPGVDGLRFIRFPWIDASGVEHTAVGVRAAEGAEMPPRAATVAYAYYGGGDLRWFIIEPAIDPFAGSPPILIGLAAIAIVSGWILAAAASAPAPMPPG